jgi:hypothetical protein
MRGHGLQQRLTVGVASVALLLAAGVPATQAAPCYDPSLDGLRADRCSAAKASPRKLQTAKQKPVKKARGAGSSLYKAQ